MPSFRAFFRGSKIPKSAVLHVSVRHYVPGLPVAIRALGDAYDVCGGILREIATGCFELVGEAHGAFLVSEDCELSVVAGCASIWSWIIWRIASDRRWAADRSGGGWAASGKGVMAVWWQVWWLSWKRTWKRLGGRERVGRGGRASLQAAQRPEAVVGSCAASAARPRQVASAPAVRTATPRPVSARW